MSQSVLPTDRGARSVFSVPLDHWLAILAIGALLFVPVIGNRGAIGFLAAGGLLMLRHLPATADQLLRNWPMLLLPIFCTLTFLWSQYPTLSLRFGIQLLATVAVAVVVAHRMPARLFVQTLFWALALTMLGSIFSGNVRFDGVWYGIYGSKNALAGAAAMFVAVAFGLALDRSASLKFRAIAAIGFFVGLLPLIQAQSVSALMIVPPTLLMLLALLGLPVLSKLQRAMMGIFALLVSALVAVLIVAYFDDLSTWLLDATGKDLTLTGRTDLWNIALQFIRERPFFGMGYQAFWVQGHQPAEELWFLFNIKARGGFSFHNTYLSNAVEIGILGVLLQIFLLYGALLLTGAWALRSRNTVAALLFTLVMMVVWISFIEVPIFFQFSARTVIIVCAFVYGGQAWKASRQRA